MTRRFSRQPRRGAVAVETAIVYPVMVFLQLLLIVGGMGVHRHQQVACLASETARWTSLRGSDRQKETGTAPPTQTEIFQRAVLPLTVGMDPAKLTLRVQWVDPNTGGLVEWDDSNKAPTVLTANDEPVAARVRITLTYQWSPDFFFTGSLTMRSVAEVPMSF